MRIRIEEVLSKLEEVDKTIEALKVKLSSNIDQPENEILRRELNDLMLVKMFVDSEIADCFDLVEIRLRNL
jgi:hypothetical protein